MPGSPTNHGGVVPFYNQFRTHLTLDMNTPVGRVRQSRSSPDAEIETVGLFHGFLLTDQGIVITHYLSRGSYGFTSFE